jgi:hypothetical protein
VGAWGAASADLGVPLTGTSATTHPAAAAAAAFGCVDWYQYPAEATPASLAY